jgi:hypothetical protein
MPPGGTEAAVPLQKKFIKAARFTDIYSFAFAPNISNFTVTSGHFSNQSF